MQCGDRQSTAVSGEVSGRGSAIEFYDRKTDDLIL